MHRRLLALASVLVLSCLLANHMSAATLGELSTQYDKEREAIAWKYVEKQGLARAGYTNALGVLESSFKAKGNLESVLAVRKERDAVASSAGSRLPTGQTIPEIADLRMKNEKAVADVILEEKRAIVSSAQQYVERLKALEKELTVGDKIDAAVEVMAKRKKVMEEPDIVAALAVVKEAPGGRPPAQPGQARPDDQPGTGEPKDGSNALFNGANLSGWNQQSGEWAVDDGCIKGTAAQGLAKLSLGESAGQDYEFMVKVKVTKGDDAGIVFHDCGSQAYFFSPKSGLIEISSKRLLVSPARDFAAGAWHELRVSAHGKQVQVAVNGRTVWRGSDVSVDGGQVGLWVRSGGTAVFSGPRIKALKPLETIAPRPGVKPGFPDGGGFGRSKGGIKTFD